MGSQFHIGYINYMDWEWSSNVKYVGITVIGVEEHLKDISVNGDIVME